MRRRRRQRRRGMQRAQGRRLLRGRPPPPPFRAWTPRPPLRGTGPPLARKVVLSRGIGPPIAWPARRAGRGRQALHLPGWSARRPGWCTARRRRWWGIWTRAPQRLVMQGEGPGEGRGGGARRRGSACRVRLACGRSASERRGKGCEDFCLSQGQNLAVTVLYVPYSLDSGTPLPHDYLEKHLRTGLVLSNSGFRIHKTG